MADLTNLNPAFQGMTRRGRVLFSPITLALALMVISEAVVGTVGAQTLNSSLAYGGATFVKRLDGAGRFGAGLDFNLSSQFDLGGELGTIHRNDVGVLASGNLTCHFARPRRRRDEGDRFLVAGLRWRCSTRWGSDRAPDGRLFRCPSQARVFPARVACM